MNAANEVAGVAGAHAGKHSIGSDTRSGPAMLEHGYDTRFEFTGKIDKLTVNLAPDAGS